jgi:hypothetical protein
MSIRNQTRGTLLAKTLLTLSSHFQKTLTHFNRNGLPEDCAVWIAPCNAIYTVGMHRPVDIVFLDKDGRVVRMLRNFPPDCLAESAPEAVSAVKLPANRLRESGTRMGDVLELDPN